MTTNIEALKPKRPYPVNADIELTGVNRRIKPQSVVEAIIHGENVMIKDFYSTGLGILAELKKYLKKKFNELDFQEQRNLRSAYHNSSQRLLLLVKANKLAVRKAPTIGWLKILYPDISDFLLSFPDVQGLNSSWQWFEKGIKMPFLNQLLHPYYGTYFPTRFEHINLFVKWMKSYKGPKRTAFDIGTGCGIISFILLQEGFEKVYATDINKNAILGVNEEIKRMKLFDKLILGCGDLLEPLNQLTELIVFNPPWLPASFDIEGLDKAIYYDEELFPRFFKQAHPKLKANGKVVMLFSNLAQSAGVSDIHPVEEELLSGKRFKKDTLIRKKVGEASKKTKRNQNWRKNELVELWVLSAV